MDTSTFETPLLHMQHFMDLLVLATIVFAIFALSIVGWYLVRRPPLNLATKLALLLGVFIFPIMSAGSGNVVGFEATKTRSFCSGCHVMIPYTEDAANPNSHSLASMHSRNGSFGEESCYTCHADYSMFGTFLTKADGMKHAYLYVAEYRSISAEDTFGKIQLYSPFRNETCMRCHSTTLEGFNELEDHRGAMEDIKNGKVSCVSSGCHGYAHPFSKKQKEPEVAQ